MMDIYNPWNNLVLLVLVTTVLFDRRVPDFLNQIQMRRRNRLISVVR